tara:strand:+ start:1730 stop:2842 length:1113 start_codon:yes stop_codon:yes gene_type:complete
MKNSKTINLKSYLFLLVIIFSIFITEKINSIENKIIFKINGKAYTTLDYEMRVKYLDFVGSNKDLDKNIILDDFISANIFYQYFINSKINKNYNNKINQIFEDIIQLNIQNNKKYNYQIVKENMMFNIKIDFVRKTILESIINSNIDDLNISKKEIDLLYQFKIKYINFENTNTLQIEKKINELSSIDFNNVITLLKENKINFFLKEKEINNIQKTGKIIRDNILNNKKYFFVKKNNDFSIVFIEKNFETLDGLIAKIFSVRSKERLNKESLNCNNLVNIKDNANIINKDYKFVDLNNELKNKLVNINDYLRFSNDDNENVYIILCEIKFDKEKLSNYNLNKLINLNANDIEKKFINKYSKQFNLVRINE